MKSGNVSKLVLSKPISRNPRQHVRLAILEYEQECAEETAESEAEDAKFEAEYEKYFAKSSCRDDYWYDFRNQRNFNGFDDELYESWDTNTSTWNEEREFAGVDWEARHCMGEG